MRLDFYQERIKFCIKDENFPRKVLAVRKKFVPLHPLSKNGRRKELLEQREKNKFTWFSES